ncbi:MAG: hypothetical protein ACREQ4_12640 [Candidatus Binataceae bacterium]
MATKNSDVTDAITRLMEALVVEIPTAATKRLLNDANQKELHQAGWKAYDAWVRIANEAANQLYANPIFGAAAGRSIDAMLRWRRMFDATSSNFFGALWPSIGVPTAREMQAMRGELNALRDELRERDRGERLNLPAFDDGRARPSDGAEACGLWNGIAPVILTQLRESKADVGI